MDYQGVGCCECLLCTIFPMNTFAGIPFEKQHPADTLQVSVSLWMLIVSLVQRIWKASFHFKVELVRTMTVFVYYLMILELT